jgi:hypothetical protein
MVVGGLHRVSVDVKVAQIDAYLEIFLVMVGNGTGFAVHVKVAYVHAQLKVRLMVGRGLVFDKKTV